MSVSQISLDALVIGGGLAGSALAIHLARAGRPVTLFERESGPHHKVCGEFLSREAVSHLEALGLNLAQLGAVPIHTIRFGATAAPLGFTARSLSRCTLDEALLQLAIASGVNVRRGHRISRFAPEPGQPVFLATGKHDLPQHRRPPGLQPDLIGFKMHWRLRPAQHRQLDGVVELAPFPGGYYGLQAVESGTANLCLLIHKRWFKRVGGRWPALLTHLQKQCPLLAERLSGAAPLWPAPLAVAPIPYGYRQKQAVPGLWHLGDQAAVIPSFAGNGMSIALESAQLAAAVHLQGGTSEDYRRTLARQIRGPVQLATRISQLLAARHLGPLTVGAARLWPALLPFLAAQTRLQPGPQ